MSLPSRQHEVDAGGGSAIGGSAIERYLFIAGCPRSGTSALAFLLNEHQRVALGFERFKRVRATLDPFHFTPDQFFSPVLAETDIQGELLYERLRKRWQAGAVSVIGDKVPLYTRVLPQLLERFSDGRVVVLVREPRDVAASFRRRAADPEDWWPAENDHRLAMEMWNEALEQVRAVERDGNGDRVFLLPYEPLLAGEVRWLEALLWFIGLSATAHLEAEHQRLAAGWTTRRDTRAADPDLLAYVETHTDIELLDWARARMDFQLAQAAKAPRSRADDRDNAGEDEPSLNAGELEEREREREQLLAQMRRPGRRGREETEILERRFLEQAAELVRRGERARRSMPT
jgi:hypothetical protein